jgi:hypothetical protein
VPYIRRAGPGSRLLLSSRLGASLSPAALFQRRCFSIGTKTDGSRELFNTGRNRMPSFARQSLSSSRLHFRTPLAFREGLERLLW